MVETAEACLEKYPRAKYFFFTDEDFFTRTLEDIREFAETYPKRVGLPFQCLASPQQITEEKMALLVKAGLLRIDIGVESGSERIKKELYNRPVPNDIVLRAAAIINRYPQVVTFYFFIIGNPYESRGDLLDTIGLVKRLPPPYFLQAYNLVFIPGTILFKKACQDGIIIGMEDSGYEIDFLAGLEHRTHVWKSTNLYLNSLIFSMAGKSTHRRMGLLPRALLPILVHPRVIDFNDRHHTISKASILLSQGVLRMRRKGSKLVIRMFKDPRSIYILRGIKDKITALRQRRKAT